MSESDLPKQLNFRGNGGTYPPHAVITADDHGPVVVVATWILSCLMTVSCMARFGTRRVFDREGAAICVAVVWISFLFEALQKRSAEVKLTVVLI